MSARVIRAEISVTETVRRIDAVVEVEVIDDQDGQTADTTSSAPSSGPPTQIRSKRWGLRLRELFKKLPIGLVLGTLKWMWNQIVAVALSL